MDDQKQKEADAKAWAEIERQMSDEPLTEVRARAYLDLVGLAKLAGDLHRENRELRFEVESLERQKKHLRQQFLVAFNRFAQFERIVANLGDSAGGLEVVRRFLQAYRDIQNSNPPANDPQN